MNNFEKPVSYLTSLQLNQENHAINSHFTNGTIHSVNPKRTISVNSTGEFSLPPDKVKLNVVIKSCKENIEDAKQSVQRRYEYIYQSLRKHRIKVVFKKTLFPSLVVFFIFILFVVL